HAGRRCRDHRRRRPRTSILDPGALLRRVAARAAQAGDPESRRRTRHRPTQPPRGGEGGYVVRHPGDPQHPDRARRHPSESLFQIVMGAMTVAGVVYTQETLLLGDRAEAAFALMTASMSAGAVLGAFSAHRVERRIGRPFMLALGYLGPFFLLTALFQPQMPVIYIAWFCFGLLDALAVISFQAYLAEAVPERLRGRVYAAWGAVVALAGALAYYGIGLIIPWLGAPVTFAIAGTLVGLGAPLVLLSSGAIRSVRTQTA